MILMGRGVVLSEEGGSSRRRVLSVLLGATVAGMLQPRMFRVGLRRIGWVRVDYLTGLVLLVVFELQVWLSLSGLDTLMPAVGGVVFSLAVAVRRRWPLAGILVILAVVAAKTLLGSRPGGLHNAVAMLPALILLFYGMGAFAPKRRSRWVFGLALLVSSLNVLATPGRTAWDLLPSEILKHVRGYESICRQHQSWHMNRAHSHHESYRRPT